MVPPAAETLAISGYPSGQLTLTMDTSNIESVQSSNLTDVNLPGISDSILFPVLNDVYSIDRTSSQLISGAPVYVVPTGKTIGMAVIVFRQMARPIQ